MYMRPLSGSVGSPFHPASRCGHGWEQFAQQSGQWLIARMQREAEKTAPVKRFTSQDRTRASVIGEIADAP
ncbi:hypothetical protein GCM10023167_00740 [Brevibacterium pityocampae]|uniref:Uncharacterized protein n=1 Tax=Brevibacterium pityocampae TaxID=506594 RepID=A0ABP8J0K2_9MICO